MLEPAYPTKPPSIKGGTY